MMYSKGATRQKPYDCAGEATRSATAWFYYIPNAAISALIIHAVADLVASPAQSYGFWRVAPLERRGNEIRDGVDDQGRNGGVGNVVECAGESVQRDDDDDTRWDTGCRGSNTSLGFQGRSRERPRVSVD
jgi:hypothetical protein